MSSNDNLQPDMSELKKEIVAEIKRELIKREILKELDNKPDPSSLTHPLFKITSGFFQHPAILLLLGFVLTGVIGTALTAAWQSNSWLTQQSLLASQRILEQKYQLASDVAKAVGDTHAAPTGILLLFTNEDTPQNRKNELPKRIDHWRRTYNEWLTNNNVLLQRITVYVNDPVARTKFQEIVLDRKETNNSILNLLHVMGNGNDLRVPSPLVVDENELQNLWKEIKSSEAQLGTTGQVTPQQRKQNGILKLQYYSGNAQFHLNQANSKARDLMKMMATEIREDSIPPQPQGFWSVLSQVFGSGPAPSPSATPSGTPTPPQ
jgi:hypothetical protein